MATEIAAAVAVNRLGLGARAGEMDHIGGDASGWALSQIRTEGAPQPFGDFSNSDRRMSEFLAYQAVGGNAKAPNASKHQAGMVAVDPDAQAIRQARLTARQAIVQGTDDEFLARVQLGVTTDHGFAERWALFWSNAFTVSATKFSTAAFAGQYEREAIRPHVFGMFADLALAAEQHPAMLFYLDQARSIGPDSRVGTRRRSAGLNENLAREMMELHTVGADGGYTQADVTELARALTGWSLPTVRDEAAGERTRAWRGAAAIEHGPNAFVYRPDVHEPGERRVMGKTYPASDLAQGQAILRDLARHPATARRLSHRIAAHFVADDPPPALVARLEQAWTATGGDLAQVARALVEADETWAPQPLKVKTPYEFVISAHRALGTEPERLPQLRAALADMGQPMFAAPSPEGWPDTAADWIGPDALVKRLNWAKRFGDLTGAPDPVAVATQALGRRLGDRTRLAVARAESRPEAMTLFLMSPEFQRR